MNSPLDVLICRVPTVIERDALISFLADRGIGARPVKRSVMVNLTETANLSWLGYSALDEGYGVFVAAEDEVVARGLLEEFRRFTNVKLAEEQETDPDRVDQAGRLFFVCSFWTIALPLVANLAALYWLSKSKNTFRLRPKSAIFWIAVNICGMIAGYYIAKTWIVDHGWL